MQQYCRTKGLVVQVECTISAHENFMQVSSLSNASLMQRKKNVLRIYCNVNARSTLPLPYLHADTLARLCACKFARGAAGTPAYVPTCARSTFGFSTLARRVCGCCCTHCRSSELHVSCICICICSCNFSTCCRSVVVVVAVPAFFCFAESLPSLVPSKSVRCCPVDPVPLFVFRVCFRLFRVVAHTILTLSCSCSAAFLMGFCQFSAFGQ